jgi:Cyclin-dependent kinase regulatory subunit
MIKPKKPIYTQKFSDSEYEYRQVVLPIMTTKLNTGKLLSEQEWRALGIVQSRGWEHYAYYE